MKSEREKMLAGELYLASDPELVALRRLARERLQRLNANLAATPGERRELLRDLLGAGTRPDIWIEPPFFCDYGVNVTLGEGVFLNFGCVILDCARVEIGEKTMLGPYVQIYTAHHPLDPEARCEGPELASPVTIGARCWLGGGVVVCPGVTIGEGTTIGAGSVVTRDVPARVVAAGNPCRVLRSLEGESPR